MAIAEESKEKHVGWSPRGKAWLKKQHGVRTEKNQDATQVSRLGRPRAGRIYNERAAKLPFKPG